MNDWIAESHIERVTGLTSRDLRHWRNDPKNGAEFRRNDRRVEWALSSAASLLGSLGLDGAVLSEKTAPEAPGANSATPAPIPDAAFTVIRSAPHIRNRTVVEAVPGIVPWREAAATRVGVVNIRVRDNLRVKPGFRVRAEQISETYWKFIRFL